MAAGLCERERTESPLLLTQKGVATRVRGAGQGLRWATASSATSRMIFASWKSFGV